MNPKAKKAVIIQNQPGFYEKELDDLLAAISFEKRLLFGMSLKEISPSPVYTFWSSLAGLYKIHTTKKRLQKVNKELTDALVNIKTLKGLLPICSNCKRIRDDEGYWNQIETYINAHSDAEFSHSLCPECFTKLYPDMKHLLHGEDESDE